MKANELRLNNYVYAENEFLSMMDIAFIESISHEIGIEFIGEHTKGDRQKESIGDLDPIPITEQWLVDFGFEKTEWDNNNSFRKMIGNNDYAIVFYSNCICEIGDIIVKEIDFVHQLQNLFFALTGTELELNSK